MLLWGRGAGERGREGRRDKLGNDENKTFTSLVFGANGFCLFFCGEAHRIPVSLLPNLPSALALLTSHSSLGAKVFILI